MIDDLYITGYVVYILDLPIGISSCRCRTIPAVSYILSSIYICIYISLSKGVYPTEIWEPGSTSPPPRGLIPAPNIQSDLRSGGDRERGMPRLRISRSIRSQVLPEDGIAFDGLECNSLRGSGSGSGSMAWLAILRLPSWRGSSSSSIRRALHKPTPFAEGRGTPRHPQPRKVCASTLAVIPQVDHKCAEAVPATGSGSGPVIVVDVVAGGVVALRPHAFNVEVRFPALECGGAGLEASDGVVAGEKSAVGEAAGGIVSCVLAVIDRGESVVRFTF